MTKILSELLNKEISKNSESEYSDYSELDFSSESENNEESNVFQSEMQLACRLRWCRAKTFSFFRTS